MKIPSTAAALFVVTLLAGPAIAKISDVTDPKAPRSLPAEGRVDVSWTDPAQFSELRYSGNRWEAKQGDWVVQLAGHLRKRAERSLPPGERLSVTINDIRRAGQYEPWRGSSTGTIRFVRDVYPPRIELQFKLSDADGNVITQGQRKLIDLAFLMHTPTTDGSDPLRYEKRLIDDWLSKEFKRPEA
jgi:hypothetical protein